MRTQTPKTYPAKLAKLPDRKAIPFTIKMIGQAIKAGSKHPPIIQYARAQATTAPPKNYFLQIKAIYDDITRNRWRYVKDPHEVEALTTNPQALYELVLGHNGGAGKGKGAGDCDDITAALGALLRAIGFPIRIVTSAPPGRPGMNTHVFIQAHLPAKGWLTVDPVLHPDRELGAIAPHSTLEYWDLNGNKTGGNWASPCGGKALEGNNMMQPYETFELGGVDEYKGQYLEDWAEDLPGFGSCLGTCGYIGNANALQIELATNDVIDQEKGLYITPMLAMSPNDIKFIELAGKPLPGMRALGDNGWIYEWTREPVEAGQLSGPFRRFFKKIGKGIKTVAGKIKKGVKWVGSKIRGFVSKTAFGRFILRVKDKIVNVALKIVKPIAKFVGKWAPKLAPVAALIPGVGPAISGALAAAGKIAKLYNKYGVVIEKLTVQNSDGSRVPAEKLQFPNSKAEAAFKRDLLAEAKEMGKKSKAEIDKLNAKLRATPLPTKPSPFEKAAIIIQAKKTEAAANIAAALAKKAAEQYKNNIAAQKAAAKAGAQARARAMAAAGAARSAAAQAAAQGKAGAAQAAAAMHQAQQIKAAKERAEAIEAYKKQQAKAEKKKPKKQKFKETVRDLKKMGYRVKIRKAA